MEGLPYKITGRVPDFTENQRWPHKVKNAAQALIKNSSTHRNQHFCLNFTPSFRESQKKKKWRVYFSPAKACRVYQCVQLPGPSFHGSQRHKAAPQERSAAPGSAEEEEGRVALHSTSASGCRRLRTPRHLLYMAKAGLLPCPQPGNLLGKPDTRACCSVLRARPGSAGFKGSGPRLHPDPGDTASSTCSHSSLLAFRGKAGNCRCSADNATAAPRLRQPREHIPRGLCLPAAHPCPGQRGSLGSHTAHGSAQRPAGLGRAVLIALPFLEGKKFQLTSLEAGLGPEPKNALGSQVLTHRSQLGSGGSGTAGMHGAAAGGSGSPGPSPVLQPAPSPAGAPYVLQ